MRNKEPVDDRRAISGILHVLNSGRRWNDCLPEYHDGLQSLHTLGGAWGREVVQGPCRSASIDGDPDNRRHRCQNPPLGVRRQKTGKQKQGDWRNTKFRALAEAKAVFFSCFQPVASPTIARRPSVWSGAVVGPVAEQRRLQKLLHCIGERLRSPQNSPPNLHAL